MTGAKRHLIETHLIVSGTVQGVFFRAKTKDLADRLNLKGYVKNLPDGRVEICIEGEDVSSLIDSLKNVPPPIFIEHIEINTSPLQENFIGFTIKY